MRTYRVVIADSVAGAIDEQADRIEAVSGSVETARRWLVAVFDAIDSLSTMPQRFELAEENSSLDHEVRRLIIGRHVVAYAIDEAKGAVHVLGFRHGSRLVRPNDLPPRSPD